MKLAILHLSDIHFQATKKFVLNRTEQIANAVAAADLDWTDILIALSGDIAFSGAKNEYKIAQDFVLDLKRRLAEAKPSASIRVVAIPGNHDCDYTSAENATRKMILGYLQTNPNDVYANTQPLKHLLSVQNNFREFQSLISTEPIDNSDTASVSRISDLTFGPVRVRIHLLNTALACDHRASKFDTDQGKLFIPSHLINKTEAPGLEAYSITIMHHPLNWLESNNGVALRQIISTTSDLVLMGHQHEEEAESKDWISKDKNLWVRATALQDETGAGSGFNLILVDTENLTETVLQYRWSGALYEVVQQQTWTKSESQRAHRRPIPLNDDMRAKLEDPGTGFTHPSKRALRLDDIFVHPKLSRMGIAESGEDTGQVKDQDFKIELATKQRLTVIIGEPRAGKTTLAKRAFKAVYDSSENITPLLMDGTEINSSHMSVDRVWRLVERNFKLAYSAASLATYTQLPTAARTLIIDNWQSAQLNNAGRQILLETLEKRFSRIVLLGDETVKLEDMLVYSDSFVEEHEFAAFQIEPFGHLLRAKLIKKWVGFAREKSIRPETLHDEVHKAETVINTVLGKNLMPSHPFFVLSLLQLEQNIATTNHANGSYGYIYESLITMALAEVSKQSVEIDVYYTILGRLAWELYSTGTDTIGAMDLSHVINEYAREYKSLVDATDITNKLLRAKIIASSDGQYFFRYKYVYCFFIARYLADRLKTPDENAQTRNQITDLTEKITQEDTANIVIFLVYFTRDPELIEKLLSDAEALFTSAPLFDADKSMQFLAPAVERYVRAEHLTVSNNPETNRDEERKRFDIAAEEEKSETHSGRSGSGPNSEFARSMKLLDILGQIVRNFPGSTPGKTKVRITSVVYRLGLRVASIAVSSIEEDVNKFREFLKKQILARDKSTGSRKWSEEDLNKKVDQLTVMITGLMIFGLIKLVTGAVGLAQLRPTYDEVSSSFQDNPAVNLIDLSVSLDHGFEFPKGKVLKLSEAMREKWFARMLLKRLVAYHFMMFYVERPLVESISEKLELNTQGPEIRLRIATAKS